MRVFQIIKRIRILFCILILSGTANLNAQIDTILISARNFFADAEYSKGFMVLTNRMSTYPVPDTISMAKLQYELALFYEQYVGDLDKTQELITKITELNLSRDIETAVLAKDKLNELNASNLRYKETNAEFLEYKMQTNRQNSVEVNKDIITGLKQIINSNPEFFRKAEIYYLLGLNYMKLQKYGNANQCFRIAIKEKPAINYQYPFNYALEESESQFAYKFARKLSTIFLGFFLLITILLFYRAKPWNWFSLAHLKVLFVLLAGWAISYFLFFYIFGKSIGKFHIDNNSFFSEVVFLTIFPGEAGSKTSWVLFFYGLYAVLGIYIFSIGISVVRANWIKSIVLPLVGLFLFISASSVFYAKHVHSKVTKLVSTEVYWQKSYLYGLREIEPYMLINPKDYPNLDIEAITSEVLLEWILEYCPFDEKNTDEE